MANDIIANFEIRYRQILNPQGKLVDELPKFAGNAEMIRMYRFMTMARLFDKKAINLQRTGKLGTYASCLGHEAAHVGVGAAMREEDCLAPMYREYGAQLLRGVKMEEILLYWGGDERGNNFSGPKHDFAWCVPIATQCLHAAGVAMAFKLRKEARCAVTVLGDGGTSEGWFFEAMNFAGVHQLPCIFVIVNNQWAISVPRSIQTGSQTLAQKSIAAGIPSVQVDGNDILAVRAETEAALDRARQGLGPKVLELVTYRLSDHTTADDAGRYRKQSEVTKAWTVEPLIRVRQYMTDQGIWKDADEKTLITECEQLIDEAVERYLKLEKAPVEDMFRYMYAQMPEILTEQLEIAETYAGTNPSH